VKITALREVRLELLPFNLTQPGDIGFIGGGGIFYNFFILKNYIYYK
jgi:hypothetical protein